MLAVTRVDQKCLAAITHIYALIVQMIYMKENVVSGVFVFASMSVSLPFSIKT